METKVAVITGASGDIGSAIVKKMAKAGYNIVYHYNSKKDENLLIDLSLTGGVLAVKADLSKPKEIESMVKQIRQVFGRVDVLVNNAGKSQTKLFIDESFDSIENLIRTDLIGSIYLTNLLLPLMNKGASIINISSIWGEVGASMEVVYSAAKAGLIGFTKALAKEIGTMGIRVNAVSPGLIDTKMNNNLTKEDKKIFVEENVSLGYIGSVNDVAEAVLFLSSIKSKYITGQVLSVNGGF